ncbi:MAG: hypothetical protein WCJ64_21395 [Rhodospirillaceae bacterium]
MHVKSEPWRLIDLMDDARDGRLAAAHPVQPWSAAQVEALWDNVLNDWPIGPVVLLDVTSCRDRPWRGRLGPWQVRSTAPRRLLVEEGAGKLAALAWSLADRPPLMLAQCSAEEAELWTHRRLVLDIDQRRAHFVDRDFSPNRQLPVSLLPQAGPCLQTMTAMELRSAEREWVNIAARRVLETRVPVYVFPDTSTKLAERMLTNIRQMGAIESRPGL